MINEGSIIKYINVTKQSVTQNILIEIDLMASGQASKTTHTLAEYLRQTYLIRLICVIFKQKHSLVRWIDKTVDS